jgi:prolipoprotein diacylglyceryl transferase
MILNFIRWNIDPEITNFIGISLRYYGILFVTGLILSYYLLQKIYKLEGIPVQKLEKLTMYAFIGIIAGARLGHCLFYQPDYFLKHPIEMFLPIEHLPEGGYKFVGYQGLASHGGTIGLFLALWLYCRKTKESFVKTLDMVAIVAPLAAFFIRMANLMNSEIIGTPTNVPWAFIFVREDNIPRHPAQLYEAISYIMIFALTTHLYFRNRDKLKKGFMFGLAVALIFTARFFIEFIKEKQVPFEEQMTLDMGQILSIPLVILAVGYIIYAIKKNKPAFTIKK